MRIRPLSIGLGASAALFASALGIACNGLFDNAPGYLADTDAGTVDGAAGPVSDASPSDVTGDAKGSAEASPADGEAGLDAGFLPTALSGLVLWLDANRGVTEANGHVVAWSDQSALHNHAVAAADPTGPPYKMAGITNGLPAIRFGLSPTDTNAGPITNGGQHTPITTFLIVADNASFQFDTGDFLLLTVIRVEHNAIGAVFEKQDLTSPFPGVGLYANLNNGVYGGQIDENHTVFSSLGNDFGTWRVYGMVRHGSILTLRIDGAVNSQLDFNADGGDDAAASINCSAVGRDVTLGAQVKDFATLFDLGADLAEMIAVKGAVSPQDLATVETYLKSKYAIP
jgi:hypothetical protein